MCRSALTHARESCCGRKKSRIGAVGRKWLLRDALKGKRGNLPVPDSLKPRAADHLLDFFPGVHLHIPAREPWKNPVGSRPDRRGAVHIVQEQGSARLQDAEHFAQCVQGMRIMMDAHVAGNCLVLAACKRHVLRISDGDDGGFGKTSFAAR